MKEKHEIAGDAIPVLRSSSLNVLKVKVKVRPELEEILNAACHTLTLRRRVQYI